MSALDHMEEERTVPGPAPGPAAYQLPPRRIVRRAREWRLYDQSGDRYVDFYQADGAAFLGHRPPGLARSVAAEIDRGLWAPLPTPWRARLEKALVQLAHLARAPEPEHAVVLTPGAAPRRWWPLGHERDPGSTDSSGSDADAADAAGGPVHVTLPCPAAGDWRGIGLPQSSFTLAAFTVAAQALCGYLVSPQAAQRLELARSLPCPHGYTRSGVYWIPDAPRAASAPAEPTASPPAADIVTVHERRRMRALELGIILPPSGTGRIICPGELGRRERRNWEEFCADRTV